MCSSDLPEMDGFEVLEEFKKTGKLPVFLFVTADVQEHTEKKALEEGATGLIQKPLTEESLREVISRYGKK